MVARVVPQSARRRHAESRKPDLRWVGCETQSPRLGCLCSPTVRLPAQLTRSDGRARCSLEALLPSRKILALWATPSCAEHAQTPSGAPDASSSIGIFRRSRDSESSREKSDKKFDPFLSSGTTLVSKSAERLFYVAALVTGPR